mgnify:CR=1 FL=1
MANIGVLEIMAIAKTVPGIAFTKKREINLLKDGLQALKESMVLEPYDSNVLIEIDKLDKVLDKVMKLFKNK